ncbi:hypothetical protein [Flaviaesturariibacter amylovorans]|uniref:Uncharacterized protein n=1 Tax=Flaviaesturariibacter amylovorans TaxID=1084520 RepID=A0ABP8GQP8_9BACT
MEHIILHEIKKAADTLCVSLEFTSFALPLSGRVPADTDDEAFLRLLFQEFTVFFKTKYSAALKGPDRDLVADAARMLKPISPETINTAPTFVASILRQAWPEPGLNLHVLAALEVRNGYLRLSSLGVPIVRTLRAAGQSYFQMLEEISFYNSIGLPEAEIIANIFKKKQ